MAFGRLLGGPISDQLGRRLPMIIVMITGVTCSVLAFLFLTRPDQS